jgi:hypothetical protein
MATRQGPSITRRPGTIPFLGDFNCQILPPKTTLRAPREMGRPRPGNTPHASRPSVVDTNSQSVQRQAHAQARRDCVSTHGQLHLRIGRGTERAPRGLRILERQGRTASH